MATPKKTAGMLNFERQLDAAFPDRALPDGWIADENHTGTSSHHPDDTPGSKPEWDGDPDNIPDVRAADIKANLGPGVSSRAVCNHMARLPNLGTVVRYFIHQGLIWHVRNDFRPVEHDGDPHPTHIHVTFAFSEAADDNTTFNYRFEEIPVALTTDDKKWLTAQIDARADRIAADILGAKIGDKANVHRTVGDVLRDTAKLRGVLVGDQADTANAALPPSSPLGQLLAAAADQLAD